MPKICTDATTVAEALDIAGSFEAKQWWIDRVTNVYAAFGPWIDSYCGAIPPLSAAAGISHESVGDPMSSGDVDLVEVGLWSITEGVAINLDIDPLDPEAAIWAGAYLRNIRMRDILADPFYAWLKDADPFDWTKICLKMPGSLGGGGWKQLVGQIFGSGPMVGSERRKHPYAWMKVWIKQHYDEIEMMGKLRANTVVCRTFRDHDVKWLETVGQLSVPGDWELVPRPDHLPTWDKKKLVKVLATPSHLREAKFPEYFHTPTGREDLLREMPRWQRNVVVEPHVEDGLEPEEQITDEDDLALLKGSTRTRQRWPIVVGGVALGVSALGVMAAAIGGLGDTNARAGGRR